MAGPKQGKDKTERDADPKDMSIEALSKIIEALQQTTE